MATQANSFSFAISIERTLGWLFTLAANHQAVSRGLHAFRKTIK